MRYRPLGASGAAISNLTLGLGAEAAARGAGHVRQLIFAALEAGINAYHFASADPLLMQVAGEALGHVERRLVHVGLTLGQGPGGARDFAPIALGRAIERGLHASGLGWFDLAVLDRPAEDELPQTSLTALKAVRKAGHVRMLGVAGNEPVTDLYVSTGAFDALFTPFHANIEWRVRARMRAALERQMSLFISDYYPDALSTARKAAEAGLPPKRGGLFGLGARRPAGGPAHRGSFAFLHQTPGWTAEEICLAYALTDPGVSSVLVRPDDRAALEALAAVPERDLPAGLPAQIEMARVDSAV